MAAAYGYSYVPDKGYIAFAHDLSQSAWKEVSLKKYDFPDGIAPGSQLLDAPRPVLWKLRATRVIGGLREVLGLPDNTVLKTLDEAWDRAQRRLFFAISAAAEDPDADRRDAAERVRAALLSGSGTAQTNLGYDEEVDFGRHQRELAGAGLAGDIKQIGLGAAMSEVESTTEALARGLGRGAGQKRAPRSVRAREALSICSATFNAIHDEIAWLVEHTAPGEAREHLERLHAPLLALLERYPPPQSGREAPPTPATPVVSAVG